MIGFNSIALNDIAKLQPFTGYACHGIPVKGRSPQSLDHVQVEFNYISGYHT